ncbi:MAG: hypothetical protein SFY32_15975 [Bacteroidota bacterium]|nr:hypothetical protein [Bacteroidota bacterium]
MKRRFLGLFIFLYLYSVTGFSISLHYCSDRIIAFSINAEAKGCACGNESKKSNCCSSKVIVKHSANEHQSFEYNFSFAPYVSSFYLSVLDKIESFHKLSIIQKHFVLYKVPIHIFIRIIQI